MACIKERVVLFFIVFSMYFMYQMSRFNINISIVAITHVEHNSTNLNGTNTKWDTGPIVLGSFFWLCWITELTGVVLVEKFGCRIVLTVAFLMNTICSFLFPIAYKIHPLFGASVRAIQGLSLGTTFPATAWLTARWIPKTERGRFLSSYHGMSLGSFFTYLTGGVIIENLGWQYVFYLTGVLSLLWLLIWWPNAYDTPEEHPRISKDELAYLQENIPTVQSMKSNQIPWRAIFTSKPFWALNSVFFILNFLLLTLAMQIPTYYDTVHGLDIKTNGYLLCIPDITKLIVGTQGPLIVENLMVKGVISLKTARKFSCAITFYVPAVFLIFLGLYGDQDIWLAVTLITLTISMTGFGSSSVVANAIDISPNYAGIITGVLKTLTNLNGILSPLLVKGLLSLDNNNWNAVFFLSACFCILNCTFFLCYGSTEAQPWNKLKEESIELNDENKELLKINPNKPVIVDINKSGEVTKN